MTNDDARAFVAFVSHRFEIALTDAEAAHAAERATLKRAELQPIYDAAAASAPEGVQTYSLF